MSGGGEERESLGRENIDGGRRGGAKRERKKLEGEYLPPLFPRLNPPLAPRFASALSPDSLSSPPPLAGDLAPEMPYGDDCGGGYSRLWARVGVGASS